MVYNSGISQAISQRSLYEAAEVASSHVAYLLATISKSGSDRRNDTLFRRNAHLHRRFCYYVRTHGVVAVHKQLVQIISAMQRGYFIWLVVML